MTTKSNVKLMCDSIIEKLSWIDVEPTSELIEQLKTYRQRLIDYPNEYVEGTMTVFPLDPRINVNGNT